MTGTQYIANFERFEKKYIMNTEQMQLLRPVLDSFMQPDLYPTSTNCSIYMDTEDHLLVRRSISKPDYKEKLRLRSYGTPGREDTVFLEIKKKTGGIVYKRRISLTASEAMDYLLHGIPPCNHGQIMKEIDWMVKRYELRPSIMISYDRVSYAEITPSPNSLRITIDRNLRYRDTDLDLCHGDYGEPLTAPGTCLMELKTARALPLPLLHAMSALHIRPISFSKVGEAYQKIMTTDGSISLAV